MGLPDKQDTKKWEEEETQATKNLYKNLSEILNLDNSIAIREKAIKNKFISTILERLHIISKEPKRRFEADYE